jgi:excisionase family DNA binding protein
MGEPDDAIGAAEARGRSVLIEQAAELLGVSRRTVYYRIREGKLRTIRTRCGSQRILLESIELLLRERAEKNRAALTPRQSEAEALALEIQTLP